MMIFDQGQYSGQITGQGFGESKAKDDGTPGTPYFYLTFMPDAFHDPREPEPVSCAQIERTIRFYLTDGTAEFVSRDLRRLGFDGDTFSDLDPDSQTYHSFVGQREKFYCKYESYNGKEHERWSLAATGIQHTKIDDKKKRHLDAQFGRFLKATPKVAKPKDNGLTLGKNAPADLQEAAAASGDDIPF